MSPILYLQHPLKKAPILLLASVLCFTLLSGCAGQTGNFSDSMKLPPGPDISATDGPDSIARKGDHKSSDYFKHLDVYNMSSTDSLTILPHFKTIQQSSEWSCGVACALMTLDYLGKADGYTEYSLAELRPAPTTPSDPENPAVAYELNATSLPQIIGMLEAVGDFDIRSTLDYKGDALYEEFTLSTIPELLAEGRPIMVAWNEFGGHWQVIIGYDTIGTEAPNDDVIIMADPYDTNDHNQDGYMIYGAQRFFYNFTTANFFDEKDGNDRLFVAPKALAA